jgi:hypothetical protein
LPKELTTPPVTKMCFVILQLPNQKLALNQTAIDNQSQFSRIDPTRKMYSKRREQVTRKIGRLTPLNDVRPN